MSVTSSANYLRELLDQARYYDFCTDGDRALAVLNPIWKNIEDAPNTDGLDETLACEILLVCGSIVSYQGQMRQRKSFQESANDSLTRARTIAEKLGDRELLAEAEKQMGLAYFRLGQYHNAIACFNTLLGNYSEGEQITKIVCLAAQSNLLMTYVKNDEPLLAFDLLNKIQPHIENCENLWLKNMFYNQAAGVHLKAGNFKHAVPFLEKAVELSHINRNAAFLGNALNNLALVYLTFRDPSMATVYVEQAIAAYSRLNQPFTLGVVLDTKAQIQIARNNLKKALLAIDESIEILKSGENYPHLVESQWTRTTILAKSGDDFNCVRQFTEMMQVVENHLNQATLDFYIKKFTRLLYLRSGDNFYDQSENFRIHLLDTALEAGGGVVNPTAELLGISHQNTSKLLRKYPHLCEKHKVKMITRSPSPTTKSATTEAQTATVIKLNSARLKHLNLTAGDIVRFERCPIVALDLSKPVVIQDDDENYHCGILVDAFEMFAFEDGLGNIERTFLPSQILDCGQVTAVFDDRSQTFILWDDY